MLSLHRMSRLIESDDTGRLWAELAGHGVNWPLPLRVRLEDTPVAAWALALRRLCELTHGPTPLARQLTHRLLGTQQPHGAWTLHDRDDALTTALAAAALHRRLREPGADRRDDHARLRLAHEAALAALDTLQHPADGLFGGPEDQPAEYRLTQSVFILFLLAEDHGAAGHLKLLPLRDTLDRHADRFDPAVREVYDMANLLLDHAPAPTPLAA